MARSIHDDSTAAVNQRLNDMSWPAVLGLLREGAMLFRPTRMRDYYTWPRPGMGFVPGHCITVSRVKQLEADGVLMSIGADQYGLSPDWVEPEPVSAPADDQLSLFGAA